jgi:hypothetical protein
MTAELHLVLVHQPGCQAMEDFLAIADHVREMAPDIDVFVVGNMSRNAVSRKKAAARPSLVVSPGPLGDFRPLRGKVWAGAPMDKLFEFAILRDAGLPIPTFEEIRPGTVLSEEVYGPYVVVKPAQAMSSLGAGVSLARTRDVRYRAPSDYPEGHPGRLAPMMAQRFIRTGEVASYNRILTLFGEPIFGQTFTALDPLPSLDTIEDVSSIAVRPHGKRRRRSFQTDPAMFDFARQVALAPPNIPLKGVDVLREPDGSFWVLEVNPGGNTWAFSNVWAPEVRADLGDDLTGPFDSWRRAARVLIERTRAEAE